jgi:hypothetical protein
VESQVSNAFSTAGFAGSALESVQCRTTFCRVVAQHDSEAARDEFEELAFMVPLGTVGIPVGSEGDLKTVVYFIRRGYDNQDHAARQ